MELSETTLEYIKMAFDDPESGQFFSGADSDGTTITVQYHKGWGENRIVHLDHTHTEQVVAYLKSSGEDDIGEICYLIDGGEIPGPEVAVASSAPKERALPEQVVQHLTEAIALMEKSGTYKAKDGTITSTYVELRHNRFMYARKHGIPEVLYLDESHND